MTVKYANVFRSPKFTQIWIFGLKMYHLATLVAKRLKRGPMLKNIPLPVWNWSAVRETSKDFVKK
jgi:hypothetical protein